MSPPKAAKAVNSRSRAAAVLRRSAGELSTTATSRMLTEVDWFRDLPAEDRAWVGQIVQAGIQSFVEWHESDVGTAGELWSDSAVAASVFGVAPRALAGVITLQQTVDLVRLSIEVVESNVDALIDPADAADVHASVLRYAREVAFAAAEV